MKNTVSALQMTELRLSNWSLMSLTIILELIFKIFCVFSSVRKTETILNSENLTFSITKHLF